MAMTLQQALRSLCIKSGWCYAVFWKQKRRSRMVLTYEDGYYDNEKPMSASNWAPLPLIIGNHMSSENNGMHEREKRVYGYDATGVEDQIGLAVTKMFYHVYSLGEGIIGRVALTGKHRWIFGGEDDVHASEVNTYPAGWANQFTVGIKTIAVVAVPQGVVQLGSTYMIMEDINLVGRIRSLFATLQNGSGTCLSKASETQNRTPHNVHMPVSLPIVGSMTMPAVVDGPSNLHLTKSGQDSLVDVPRTELNSFWSNSLGVVGNGNNGTHFVHQPQFSIAAKAPRLQIENSFHHSQTPQLAQPFTSFSSQIAPAPNIKSGLSGSLSPNSKFSSSLLGHWNINDITSSLQLIPIDSVRKENMQCPSLIEDFTFSPIMSSSAAIVTRTEETSENCIDVAEMLAENPPKSKISPISKCQIQEELFSPPLKSASIASSSQLQIPGSESIKVDPFEVVASTPIEQCQGWGRDIVNKDTHSSSVEKDAEYSIPIKVDLKDSELTFSGVCESSLNGSWLGLDVLDDVDAFVASLAKDGCSQVEPASLTHSQPNMCDELSEVLAPIYKKGSSIYKKGSLKDGLEECDENKFLSSFEFMDPFQSCTEHGLSQALLSSSYLIEETIMSETKAEPLLEAIVAGLTDVPKPVCPNSTRSSLYQTPTSTSHTGSQTNTHKNFNSSEMGLPLADRDESRTSVTHIPLKSFTSGKSFLSGRTYETDTEASIKLRSVQELTETSSSVHVEEGKSKKSQESVITESLSGKKTEESGKGGRKRVRPGEASRPRPKDRQQIQDRVRELREIVPNGAKCSIDALLERTIKHMHFLQTVTQHGGKWKNSGEEGREHDSSILGMEQLENGASWALELGGQGMGCPIVVKNLSQPGQLLVEMMCDEKGLFLEIADTIRGLGLTILKGVMEARNDKIQAQFIVEAARDVHRVEILWALTQLLQPTATTSSTVTSQGLVESRSLDSSPIISVFRQDSLAPLCMRQGLR
ncbi:hypothetical protein O6H91_19G004800 [Diphasiastrum complanatum]|uniref:Uncharacterized protein n=4 Tax=Diphasiastrum complanatum TaxID=34168 RepID=A0ACC2AS89_DIPCM|nr:hypothetical protein O6H91_19G004800 [Diphasiastrum complanatum]KAJ7520410.1 hypothetical protein O6H91_19G004800 [Diphasiastrum complanatum]KAJ7520411.1 hypothetical protein O6H91_19G004800 [Diphasiastrum complanatum]KAJ7520412.1 hypothetical protein O6H91_19G004800 [Diphasiastrum complanatum]